MTARIQHEVVAVILAILGIIAIRILAWFLGPMVCRVIYYKQSKNFDSVVHRREMALPMGATGSEHERDVLVRGRAARKELRLQLHSDISGIERDAEEFSPYVAKKNRDFKSVGHLWGICPRGGDLFAPWIRPWKWLWRWILFGWTLDFVRGVRRYRKLSKLAKEGERPRRHEISSSRVTTNRTGVPEGAAKAAAAKAIPAVPATSPKAEEKDGSG